MSTRGKRPRSAQEREGISRRMRAFHQRWLAEDPESRIAGSVIGGTKATGYLWRCDECGRVIRGPSIGTHQKILEHHGRTLVGTTSQETQ